MAAEERVEERCRWRYIEPIMAKRKLHGTKRARQDAAPARRSRRRAKPAPRGRGGAGRRGEQWIYGVHAVLAALANPQRRCLRLLLTATAEKSLGKRINDITMSPGDESAAGTAGLPAPEITTAKDLEGLLPAGAVHQGIAVEALDLPETGIEDIIAQARDHSSATVVVLDQVTDPRNVGAVMRSTAAFGALAVIQTARGGSDLTAALAKAASGALDMVPLVRVTNLSQTLDRLKEAGFWCIGLDAGAPESVAKTDLSGKVALVLGAEGKGLRRLSRERCDVLAHIPIAPRLGSLNVSAAAAIALYETVRQRGGPS